MPVDVWEQLHWGVQAVIAAGVVCSALLAVGAVARRILRVVAAIHAIVDRELTPNGGSSLRDEVADTAKKADSIDKRVGSISEDMQAWHAAADRDHAEMWSALGELGYDRRRRG